MTDKRNNESSGKKNDRPDSNLDQIASEIDQKLAFLGSPKTKDENDQESKEQDLQEVKDSVSKSIQHIEKRVDEI